MAFARTLVDTLEEVARSLRTQEMVKVERIRVDAMSQKHPGETDKSTILMTMEKSSMASTWGVMLKLTDLGAGNWDLTECGQEIIGNFYELVPEEERFDDNGEMIIPQEIDGKKVLGIEDGEWLLGEGIVDGEGVTFKKETLAKAKDFLEEYEWTLSAQYEALWWEIVRRVSQEN